MKFLPGKAWDLLSFISTYIKSTLFTLVHKTSDQAPVTSPTPSMAILPSANPPAATIVSLPASHCLSCSNLKTFVLAVSFA